MLKYSILFLCLTLTLRLAGQEEGAVYESEEELDEVVVYGEKINAATIREILGGLINGEAIHALQATNVMELQEIQSLVQELKQETGIPVASKSYIDGDSFWYQKSKEWAEEDYRAALANLSVYLSNEIKFSPLESNDYTVGVQLTPSDLLKSEGFIKG